MHVTYSLLAAVSSFICGDNNNACIIDPLMVLNEVVHLLYSYHQIRIRMTILFQPHSL